MKLYDKIWEPEKAPKIFGDMEDGIHLLKGPVIVVTIEELGDLWNAGYRAAYSDLGKETRTPAVDFESYLQSKGINI